MYEDKKPTEYKGDIKRTNPLTNLWFKANMEKYTSPSAIMLFQHEALVEESWFPLFHSPCL